MYIYIYIYIYIHRYIKLINLQYCYYTIFYFYHYGSQDASGLNSPLLPPNANAIDLHESVPAACFCEGWVSEIGPWQGPLTKNNEMDSGLV